MKAGAAERTAFLQGQYAVMSLLYMDHFTQLLEIITIFQLHEYTIRELFKYKKTQTHNVIYIFPLSDGYV